MTGDIRDYAKTGLVHHMLFPDCSEDANYHLRTLQDFVKRRDIETLDCCLPLNGCSQEAISAVRECGKTVCFAIHFYPLRTVPLAARTPDQHRRTWQVIDDMILQAAAIGAEGFIFGPGIPSFHEAGPEDFAAFDRFCRELCAKLQPHGMDALMEPFDTDIDKKFLYGPVSDCVELATRITEDYPNFGLELDVAHLPLMHEDASAAIAKSAPFLKRIHLGNCMLKDRKHPRWGDTHPPIGFPGGEIDTPQLVPILRTLLDCGFLNRRKRGNLVLEMTPFPGRSVNETIADSWRRLEAAWKRV